MAEPYKTKRLAMAASELNVGVDRVIDHLHKKGFKDEFSNNTKLTEEMYAILVKEFSKDKEAKENAQSIKLEYSELKDKTKEESPKEEPTADKKEQKAESSKTKEEVVKPTKKETETIKAKTEKKIEVKVVDKKEITAEKVKKEKAVKETKKAEKSSEKDKTIEDKVTEIAEDTKAKKETKKSAEIDEKEDSVSAPVSEEVITDQNVDTKGKSLKVVGKLDLEKLNKKKSQKDTKKEKPSEKEESTSEVVEVEKDNKEVESIKEAIQHEQEDKKENKEDLEVQEKIETKSQVGVYSKDDSNFLKTEFTKLEGPTIINKINLPEPFKPSAKKPVATSTTPADQQDSKNKKKKRKRLNKGKVDIENVEKQHTEKKENKAKANINPKRKAKPEVKVELTDEEIQKQISDTLQRLGGAGKSKASKYRREKRIAIHQQKQEELAQIESEEKNLRVVEFITVNDLATMMNVPVTQVIATCMSFGVFVSINERLDAETITILADEFGFNVQFISTDIQEVDLEEDNIGDPTKVQARNPIVTVMGHVDHGKTSLLDYVRNANVVAGEAGGITQHVGAYEVQLKDGRKITFIDTPGHEAFTAMRARGAKVTDIVIVVIAADSSVMPQTEEAINHAKAAGVPIIFAINKIDVPNANPDKIKEQLSAINILVEDWGGKYQSQEISAKKGTNVDLLLEKVLLEAEMLELKANPTLRATGTVIESLLDKGKGYIAKTIVEDGTLRVGDFVLAGTVYGKVKALYNERNIAVKEVLPSAPISILGLNGAPQAGDKFIVMNDEREAKTLASQRQQLSREIGIRTQKHITLDEIGRRIAIGDFKELNLIVKGDVDGSVEALSGSLLKLSNPEVQVNVIHKSVGAITESDVTLAMASNAIIIGFQVRPTGNARKIAEREEIDIRLYSIIYTAINEIKQAIEGLLSPDIEEKIVSNIEVREVYHITKVGNIAGCMVLEGKINRNSKIRVIRDGIVIHTGTLGSLKRFKDDVKEVSSGFECGLNINSFNDIQVGDIIEGYEEIEIKRKL